MRRRDFFGAAAGTALFSVAAPGWAVAAEGGQKRLIVILLRGAVDGLNVVVPYAEEAYYQERRSIAIAPPGKPDGALNLDEHFGLHPALASLMPLWAERGLAGPDAIAFRRPALHRERHTGTKHDPGRLDESAASGASRSARPG